MTAPLNNHIQNNLIEMVKDKLLLERITLNGVDVNRRDQEGNNALYWAITKNSTYNANLLLSFGSSLMVSEEKHALIHAIEANHYEMVVLLIQRNIDVHTVDTSAKTALMYAIETENFTIVKFLVTSGANIYALDNTLNMTEDYVKACNSVLIKSYFKHIIQTDVQKNTSHTK